MDGNSARHVFFVQSPITEICADAVAHSLDLRERNQIFIGIREYQTIFGREYIKFPFPVFPAGYFSPKLLEIGQYRDRHRGLDQFMSKVCGNESFHLYLPHSNFDFSDLLVSNSNCLSLNYIEEGKTSYNPRLGPQTSTPLKKFKIFSGRSRANTLRLLTFGSRARPLPTRHFHIEPSICYGLFDEAFPWAKQKIIFDFKKEMRRLTRNENKYTQMRGSIIVALDGEICYRPDMAPIYFDQLRTSLLSIRSRGARKVFFKLHPAEADHPSGAADFFQHIRVELPEITFEQLPSTSCLESILFSVEDLVLVAGKTTLCFYAEKIGRSTLKVEY